MAQQITTCACGDCTRCRKRVSMREWKRRNAAKLTAEKKAWVERNREKANETAARYRARHPEKKRAHNAVNNAIRAGKMERGRCEVCGAENAHAHHEDYSRPLDVRWFCRQHHEQIHRASQEPVAA